MTGRKQYKGVARFYGQWDKLVEEIHSPQLFDSEAKARKAAIEAGAAFIPLVSFKFTNVKFDVIEVEE